MIDLQYFMTLMLPVSGGKELIHSKQLIRHEQARIGHWITEPIRSNPWIRSVFSMLLRDAHNSNVSSRLKYYCGEGGVVQRSLQREKDSGDSGK